MRTVAHKQKPTQQTKSSNPKRPGRAFSSQSREVRSVLHSQCTIGNHAVQRLPQSSAKELHAESATPASTRFSHDFSRIPIFSPSSVQVQPKLMVNTPGDIYEQEADRVAEHVMRIPDSTVLQQPQGNHQSQKETLTHHNTPVIQRQSETEDEEEVVLQDANSEAGESDNVESISPIIDSVATTDAIALEDEEEPEGDLIQRKQRTEDSNPENTITISPHKVINGGGQPLPAAERDFFEPRFGADFSHIRIHTGQQAARTSDSLNAQAFTLGRNIAFAEGKFSPGSFSGRKLLAHELTHVIQQAPRIQRSLSANQHTVSRTYPQVMLRRNRKPTTPVKKCDDAKRHHILRTAFIRMNIPNIAKSYRSTNPWVFCPDSEHKNSWSLLQINLADKLLESREQTKRRLSKIKQPEQRKFVRNTVRAATRMLPPYWMKKQMIRKMRSLGKSLENYPAGENVVWWGDKINKCNLWVFDVLHKAGYKFLTADKAQPTLDLMWNGKVRGLKRIYSIYNVKPGDVFVASWHHTGFVHKNYGSQFIGLEYLGRKGIGNKTHTKITTTFSKDYKFYCVTK